MKMRTSGWSFITRTTAIALSGAFVAGCSGTNRFLPGASPSYGTPYRSVAGDEAFSPAGDVVRTLVQIRIPLRSRNHSEAHPSTISPFTQSVSIAVNSAKAQIFNTTPASPGCTTGSTGTTCTFAVHAKAGTDTFTVTTYNAVNGHGTALDRGIAAQIPIAKGKANHVSVRLGPLVTNTLNTGPGSLRYAVATANSGDTITFSLTKGATITLSTPISIVGNVKIAGPGATSLTISGGGTHQLFLISGTATISGLTLTRGKTGSTTPGGAINNAGSLTLASDVFGKSTSTIAIRRIRPSKSAIGIAAHKLHPHCTATTADGGAIYNNGSLVISGTIFTGNAIRNVTGCVSGRGGAIFNDQFGTLISSGDTYSNNAAEAGGAIYSAAFGVTSFTNDTFTGNAGCTAANGCPTSGCNATSCTSHAVGEGAAIFDDGIGVTVVNSTFTNNVAGGATPGSVGEGGAIALDATSTYATITGSTFTGNLAGGGTTSCSTGGGGAILAVNSIELDNDIFKNNSATGDQAGEGGAVAGMAGVAGSNDTFTGNKVVASGGACTASANGYGGGLFAGADVTFNNSTFTSNSASGNAQGAGGAIAGVGNVTISKGTFASNSTAATGVGGATSTTAAGGALLGAAIVKISNSTFTSNASSVAGTATTEGIGGAVAAQTALVSANNAYTSNSVKQTTGTAGTVAGGAVAALSGTWISNGDKFASNTVTGPGTAGAGAGIGGPGSCIISNTTITSNLARGGPSPGGGVGGGIAVGSVCELTNVVISNNTATSALAAGVGGGGGLLDTGGSIIRNSTITGNVAKTEGGGIANVSNPETIENTTISGNAVTNAVTAGMGGGGIFSSGGAILDGVTLANNAVTIGGPGPAGGGGIFDTHGIVAVYSTISGNKVLGTAPNSGGGGVYTSSGMDALNATFGNNSSSEDGGGIDFAGSANALLANVTIYKNVATHNGGNANVGGSAAWTLTNSILAGGTAAVGRDAHNLGTLTSGGYNIIGSAVAGYSAGTGDLPIGTDPKLLGLANNGGATFTFADQATGVSPGTQHIPFGGGKCGTVSVTVDQRNFNRGNGAKCDVGAYEHFGVATAAGPRPARHLQPALHFRRSSTPALPLPHLRPVKLKAIPL